MITSHILKRRKALLIKSIGNRDLYYPIVLIVLKQQGELCGEVEDLIKDNRGNVCRQ